MRPYFQHKGPHLVELFEAHGENPEILQALKEELECRDTPTMRGLLEEVEAALRRQREEPQPARVAQTQGRAGAAPPSGPQGGDGNHTGGTAADDESDDGLRGKPGKIRACGGLADVPGRWAWPPRQEVQLQAAKDAPLAERYADALRQLIADSRRQKKGQRFVDLESGEAIILEFRDRGYRFPYDGDAEFFEGARGSLEVDGRSAACRIVSIADRRLTISAQEDFGLLIAVARLKVDNTAMIEALADRLEKVVKGDVHLNIELASDVIHNVGIGVAPYHIPVGRRGILNDLQVQGVGHMLANAVTYLWGPPGTGKTQTLGLASQLLFEADKRILICSNTNQAVDQVLLKMCETLTTGHSALIEGKILRLGQIHHQETLTKFHDWISLDGVIARKIVNLRQRIEQLDGDATRARGAAEDARVVLEHFRALDETMGELVYHRQRAEALHRACDWEIARANALPGEIRSLEDEYQGWRAAGRLKRLILRSEDRILADRAEALSARANAETVIARAREEADASRRYVSQLEIRAKLQQQQLAQISRSAAQMAVDKAEERVKSLLDDIANLNKKLGDIDKTAISEARIVGATVTKSYLSPQYFAEFDVVIVDEASMVMLPALFYVAGLAKEKVVISGDFRQLSPIVPTNQQAVLDLIGQDIFHSAGIVGAFERQETLKRTVMLREQWRMNDAICRLISPRMYGGRLITAEGRRAARFPALPAPFDDELVIIDTSAIGPFVNKDGASRFNLMHVLVIRNLCRHLRDGGFVTGTDRLGICSPYAAQAKLMARVLDDAGLGDLIEAGTVHRYQGDEKVVMVIDIPDSLGERNVGMFCQAEDPDESGAKLFNVAVSRTRAGLIFVANLAYLDARLPNNAFLRDLLHIAQTRGKVIDARNVIGLWPIADDLRNFGHPFDLDPETIRSGLFRQRDFDTIFTADIERAKKGIAVFSGFVTPQRVAEYELLFRRKLAEGVPIRCITRPPQRNGSIPSEKGREALDALEAMGCCVDTRWDIHEKVAIIDDDCLVRFSQSPVLHRMQRRAKETPILDRIGNLHVEGDHSPLTV